MKGFALIASVALLLGMAPMPIGYYTFLRILVTLVATIIMLKEIKYGVSIWLILLGIITIIFNPIFPFYLYQKSLWIPLDLATAVLFFSYSLKKE